MGGLVLYLDLDYSIVQWHCT